jgi:hypothetical protein
MHHFGGPIPSFKTGAPSVRMATLDDIREAFDKVDFRRSGVIDTTGVQLAAEVRGAWGRGGVGVWGCGGRVLCEVV